MKTLLTTALTLALLAAPAFPFGKGNPHVKGHPRVNEVNGRVGLQRARIAQGEKNGTISKQEAKQLGQERHAFKQEEHTMRKADGGHLTRADQKALNQQLNQRSQQIYGDKH